MSNILIFNPNQYLESVNTPDYENLPNVIINPDISAVKDVPIQYWKQEGNTVVEMNALEKAGVDALAELDKDASVDSLAISVDELANALIAVGLMKIDGKPLAKEDITAFVKATN